MKTVIISSEDTSKVPGATVITNCESFFSLVMQFAKKWVYVIIFSLRQAYSHLRSDRNESEKHKIAIITGHTVIYQPQHWDDFEWFAVPPAIIIYYFKYQSCLIYMYKHNPLHMNTARIVKNCFINDREKHHCLKIYIHKDIV